MSGPISTRPPAPAAAAPDTAPDTAPERAVRPDLDPALLPDDLGEAARGVRRLARTDAGTAQIVAGHHSARALAGDAVAEAGGGWYGLAGPVAARPVAGGLLLTGTAPVAPGGAAADRLVLAGPDAGGLQAVVDTSAAGVTVTPAEPIFGQQAAPGAVLRLRDVVVPVPAGAGDAAAWRRWRVGDELLQTAVDLGILEGFLAAARDFLRHRARPWYQSGLARAADDPHAIAVFGDAYARSHALAELFETAAAALRPRPVGLARRYAHRHVGRIITAVIGVLGASSTSERYGLDRYWRDFRAHALRHPPYRAEAEPWWRDPRPAPEGRP